MFNASGIDFTGLFAGISGLVAVIYIQGRQGILKNKYTQSATVAFAFLVAYIWAPFGFPNSEWSRAPIGSDVVRLIPGLQFDPDLLKTNWLPMQIAIGSSTYFLALIALFGDARRANIAVILLMSVGLELSQALTNALVSPIPPYRIDIHDILARSVGVLVTYLGFSIVSAVYRWLWPLRWAPKMVPGKPEKFLAFLDTLIRRI
ncbi:MAG: hypothetical protein RLY63_868 [Chloroflexota bacterium]